MANTKVRRRKPAVTDNQPRGLAGDLVAMDEHGEVTVLPPGPSLRDVMVKLGELVDK